VPSPEATGIFQHFPWFFSKHACQPSGAGVSYRMESAMNQSKASQAAGKRTTIFVVDDEPMLLDLATVILEPLGYDVRTFREPETALTEFAKARPALVVTDYAMGGMSGIQLIHECKRLNPGQKTLLVSGTVDEHIYDGDATRPDGFLAKPYQVSDFIAAIQKFAEP
jgi:CheY-like chemotaxis protein